jgi:hypothetical protein
MSVRSVKIDLGQAPARRISDTLIDAVRQVPGVASASGSVSGYARIIGRDGEPLGVDQGSPNFGMDISDDPASAWVMREGRVPTVSTEMAMDASSYADGDFAIGDQVIVISQRGAREVHAGRCRRFRHRRLTLGSKVAQPTWRPRRTSSARPVRSMRCWPAATGARPDDARRSGGGGHA